MPDPVDDVNDALRQLVRTIERGSLSVFEALTRFSRIIGGRASTGEGQGTQSQSGNNPLMAVGNMFSGMLLKITAIIAPLASFATILAQANSGFSLLIGAFQILAATVAPILLPFFILLAAGLLTVSDMIWARLLPNLKDWYLLILTQGIPAVTSFVESLQSAGGDVVTFAEILSTIGLRLQGVFNNLMAAILRRFGDDAGAAEFNRRNREEVDPFIRGIDPKGGGFIGRPVGPRPGKQPGPDVKGGPLAGKLLDNINLVTQQLAFQMGSKPSFTGLAEASKQAQMAAFQPPFEQKMLQLNQQSLKAAQDAVAELQGIRQEHKPAPAVGPGGN